MFEEYDGIEWDVDEIPSVSSSGDEHGEFIYEFRATGTMDDGSIIEGTAYYHSNRFDDLCFDYIEYEIPEEEDDEDEDDIEE